MQFDIKPQPDYLQFVSDILKDKYNFKPFEISDSVNNLSVFLKDLKQDIYVGIEFPYVDKLYRDTYYYYYSSKLTEYKKDCIRLSFFRTEITIEDFYSEDGLKKLQDNIVGFLVIRPIPQKIIGRNVFNPSAFSSTAEYLCMWINMPAAINGVKLVIEGFPHASQDLEMTVCAETTIWSVMEYFSHKYVEYKPILPTDIYKLLSGMTLQRQLPSSGLNASQIAYVLKEFGFGIKLYGRDNTAPEKLYQTIKMYVESGIPVLAIINNNKGIVHILSIIGRTNFEINNGYNFPVEDSLPSGSSIYDFYNPPCKYVVIDDNLPPFQKIDLSDPASNYKTIDARFAGCEIQIAIVPLYKKVYMEADRAKTLAIQYLKEIDVSIPLPSIVLRVFLTSGRSYKNYIAIYSDLELEVKMLISKIDMPKFVWIGELTTVALVGQHKACGIIIMDATEPLKYGILACLIENTYIGTINDVLGRYPISLNPFARFNNLKTF